MLRELKQTYGWPGLSGLPSGALLQLLRRTARDPGEAELIERVAPLIGAGWMELLAAPGAQRSGLAASLAGRIGASPGGVTSLADACRRSIALGFAEQRAATPRGRPGPQRWIGVSVAAVLIGAAGFVLTVQAGRDRLEADRLRASHTSQQEEIKRLEAALAQTSEALQELEVSLAAAAQRRPASRLPEARSDPPAGARGSGEAPSGQERWVGCEGLASLPERPRPGEVWWSVVGAPEALEAVRRHCQPEATTTDTGLTQVARFPDLAAAERFATLITADPSHGYIFRVGEPTLF